MRYKLINSKTGEEHLCDKVTIDGYDYYVSDDLKVGDKVRLKSDINVGQVIDDINKDWRILWFKPIATTNPNIDDVPKVVDEVERLANEFGYHDQKSDTLFREGLILGYNKSQETHPFSEEDMIEFSEWLDRNTYVFDGSPTLSKNGKSIGIAKDKLYCRVDYTLSDNNCGYTTKELLQLWKEQKIKTLYYE